MIRKSTIALVGAFILAVAVHPEASAPKRDASLIEGGCMPSQCIMMPEGPLSSYVGEAGPAITIGTPTCDEGWTLVMTGRGQLRCANELREPTR